MDNENTEQVVLVKKFMMTEEELHQKHKAEKKELQATIQKLKKNINNCKKRKKEVGDEINKLEDELKSRHEQELQQLLSSSTNAETQDVIIGDVKDISLEETAVGSSTSTDNDSGKVSRAARRRAKKAEVAAVRETELEREREEALLTGPRAVEARLMQDRVQARHLTVTEVPPDGNCMYAALSLQLNGSRSAEQLRQLAADHMLAHADDFLPFLSHPDTGAALDSNGFRDYCQSVAGTRAWGGQPELRALSQTLARKIEVLQAEGAPIVLGEEFPGEPLLLAYYRHSFSLGEHYNSLSRRPGQEGESMPVT